MSKAQCDFTDLTVTSDRDYDVAHPAGQSLNDIVRFISFSPNEFIQSGYKKKFDYVNDDSLSNSFWEIADLWIGDKLFHGEQPYHPIDKLVSDLTEDDLILLGYITFSPLCILMFEKKPDESGEEHNTTVTLAADDGRVFSNSITLRL